MARGGARPGAGRKKGALSQKTRAIAENAVEAGLTPLEYMLKVLRDDESDPTMRRWAAEKAAPYVHPRLNNIDIGNRDGKPFLLQVASEDVGSL